MMRAVGVLTLCQVGMATDIQIDWPLLTDFTTEYSYNDDYLRTHTHEILRIDRFRSAQAIMDTVRVREKEHGEIKFNLNTQRLQIKGDGEIQTRPDGPLSSLYQKGITSIQGHGEIRFDGKAGFASTRGKYTANGFAFEFCVKANVPQGMIPPSAAAMPNLPQQEQRIQAQVNQVPHKDITLGGQNVAGFNFGGPLWVAMHYNGVPVGVDVSETQPSDDMNHEPLLSFTNWHSGAGHIEEVDCHSETSAIDLLATPGGIEILDHLDSVVGSFQTLSSVTPAAQVLPPKPSLLVRHAAKEELAQIKTAPVLSGALTTVVAGVSGALISAAVVMAMFRPSRYLHREPLISDDA